MGVDANLYDEEFFKRYYVRDNYIQDHKILAKAIVKIFSPKSVIDIGCGSGQILWWLKTKYNISVLGYEGSPAAAKLWKPEIRDHIRLADCAVAIQDDFKADVVVCLEVAEHLREHEAGPLVNNICRLSSKYVIFSAAPPGQGGKNKSHFNEQPWEYWAKKFKTYSFKLDQHVNRKFHKFVDDRLRCSWYRTNTRVLRND